MKKASFFTLCFFSWLLSSAQTIASKDASTELKFYDYLLQNGLLNDARLQYNIINGVSGLTLAQHDSLNYLTGWSLYQQKILDSSSFHLKNVSFASPLYMKSRFFSAYCKTFIREYDSAVFILNSIEVNDSTPFGKLLNLQRAGIALLKNDSVGFRKSSSAFDGSYYATAKEEKQLVKYYKDLSGQKNKSPAVAALLSTAVPGLGKIYAGKTGEGVIGFLQVVLLGFITAESYNKAGIKSGRFITTASLLSLFYVGNIWGSYFSVSIKKKEKRNEIYNAVLFDMHIPLRTVFN